MEKSVSKYGNARHGQCRDGISKDPVFKGSQMALETLDFCWMSMKEIADFWISGIHKSRNLKMEVIGQSISLASQ